ncbi:MAG: integral rane sensor signal transduction histidine kinase [Candidatus Eremiobacteraeota bacterium]|nr:integral rane sensor signal transduction histidine kinase [Candidatus Eremiobacteraeota bacterium]
MRQGHSVSAVGDSGVAVLRGRRIVMASGVPLPRDVVMMPAGSLAHGATVGGYRAVELADAQNRAVAFASDAMLVGEAERIRGGFLLASVPVLGLSALAGWLLARRSLRPVDEMTRLASSIAASGDMRGRLALRSEDELGRLAATFDAMLARLEASFERERGFIGDVSHELRSAIGAMTAIAEVTLGQQRDVAEYRTALESVVRRGKGLGRVIDDLLLLARADAGVLRATERVDVNDIVTAVAAEAQRATSLLLDVQLADDPLVVAATGELIARALDNLVANAVHHGRARLSLTTVRSGGTAVVSVDDDGPGIPAGERSEVFRRFYRGTSRYEGSGIGLALSATLARAYGGEVTVGESPLGGARFVLTFPLVP